MVLAEVIVRAALAWCFKKMIKKELKTNGVVLEHDSEVCVYGIDKHNIDITDNETKNTVDRKIIK